MLNWFTFGVMFLTIVLLIATCIVQAIKKESEDFTIEHLVNLQKHIIDELTEENASLKKEIKLMKSININDNYINKDKVKNKIKELENLYKNKYFHLDYVKEILQELLEEE